MPDYFNLLSKSISSPSIVYHAGTDKAWQEFEKRSGIHFPTDYKNLINKYGTGGLNNFVWFLTPFVTDENVDFMKKSKQMLDAYKISRKKFPLIKYQGKKKFMLFQTDCYRAPHKSRPGPSEYYDRPVQ